MGYLHINQMRQAMGSRRFSSYGFNDDSSRLLYTPHDVIDRRDLILRDIPPKHGGSTTLACPLLRQSRTEAASENSSQTEDTESREDTVRAPSSSHLLRPAGTVVDDCAFHHAPVGRRKGASRQQSTTNNRVVPCLWLWT